MLHRLCMRDSVTEDLKKKDTKEKTVFKECKVMFI